jgi:hypothetical protein
MMMMMMMMMMMIVIVCDQVLHVVLPGVTLRFDPARSHKNVAVTSSREEVTHRKCKLANLSDTYPPQSAPWRRLEEVEGITGDNPLGALPHSYWESLVTFHLIANMEDSKLICDLGVCKVS